MAYTIPTSTDLTHYDMQVVLDGTTYTLELRWNTRASAWFMHIFTEAGDPIVCGVRVVVDQPLGARTRDARRPSGFMFAVDTSGKHVDPTIDDLGERVQIIYLTAAELPIEV